MKRSRLLLVPAALALLAAPVLADEILLKNGRTLEGEVTEAGDTVLFKRPGLSMEIRRDEVQEIRRAPSAIEQYAKKAGELDRADLDAKLVPTIPDARKTAAAEAHHRLGLWCATKGLKDEARAEQQKAVALDPNHEGARRALGYVNVGTFPSAPSWALEDDVMKQKGLVKADGRWVTKEEAASLAKGEVSATEKARREKLERQKRQKRELNTALRLLASPQAARRVEGEKDLVAVAKDMGDPGLEAKAPDLLAYYDQAYEQIEGARALVQVHAQVVTLKRPIKTFTTSLGAFSTPVTLQLPELSVIPINTTALVPLEVDED